LSEIKSESDIERALNSLLDEGAITLNEQVELNDLAQKVLNHPQLKLIYADANKLISEKELLLPDGSTIRPDRVIISDNEVVVIDYKTGIPSEQHEVQIQKYMKWLREIESKSCRGLLVYLQKEIDIKEVS
jgi:RecB family endonuclease NucS